MPPFFTGAQRSSIRKGGGEVLAKYGMQGEEAVVASHRQVWTRGRLARPRRRAAVRVFPAVSGEAGRGVPAGELWRQQCEGVMIRPQALALPCVNWTSGSF